METQIFYWTGAAIWWALCIGTGCSLVAFFLVSPILAYKRAMKYFWMWKWGAVLAKTGFTEEDVTFAVGYSNHPKDTSLPELLKWVRNVKERGDSIHSRKAI